MTLEQLYGLASDAVCDGRNYWAIEYERDWLENDEGPDVDDFVGEFVVNALLDHLPQLRASLAAQSASES